MIKDSALTFATILMIVIGSFLAVHAQERGVPVSFREDGLKKEFTSRVKLAIDGEEAEPKYSKNGFIVPSDLKAENFE